MSTFLRDDGTFAAIAAGDLPAAAANSPILVNRNGAAQSPVTSGVFTKVQFTNKSYDPAGAFDATTNYRYQPQVAGKYLVAIGIYITAGVTGTLLMRIYKNGAVLFTLAPQFTTNSAIVAGSAAIVDMNGSSDYVEIFGFQNTGVDQAFGLAARDDLLWMSAQRIG